jgi:16S rRNA C1402 N4-methylase RsmH
MHFTMEAQDRIQAYAQSTFETSRSLLAVDATAGNGFDTLFLAMLVGERGRVIAVDRQTSAIETTRIRLEQNGCLPQTELIVGCHSRLAEYLAAKAGPYSQQNSSVGPIGIDIAMFNLGYLPLGDKSIITETATTLQALSQVEAHLRSDGLLSVISYPGHLGGSEEHRSVCDWFQKRTDQFLLEVHRDESNPRSPVLWLARWNPSVGANPLR